MQKLESVYQEQISRSSSSQEQIDESARQAMIATARDLTTSLETPLESILWMSWAGVRNSHPHRLRYSISQTYLCLLHPPPFSQSNVFTIE